MKKTISLVLAASVFMGVTAAFSGCGQLYTADINWDVDLTTPIELKGLFPASGMGSFGNDDTSKIIEEETGYKVVYQELGESSMENDVNNFLINREPFNFMKLNDGCYTPYLDGTFLDLTELLEKTPEGKVLYQLIDLMDYGWDSVKYTDSEGQTHIYAIPDFGYVNMIDTALVWNTNHLAQIGFEAKYGHALPETLSEVTWAFEALQEKFGSNKSYHAFGVPGAASAEVNPLTGCFEVPYQFYVDDNGKIQPKNFSENMTDYVLYMNYLRNKDILSQNWNGSSATNASQLFADELHSCIYISYWNVTALVNAIVAKGNIAATMGVENTFQNIHDDAIAWTLRIRGDGYTFENAGKTVSCKNQEKAKLPGDGGGVSYYTVIPAYMAENARHVINYLAKKMEAFAAFFGGREGTHWNVIDAPAGAPLAADYTEENDAEYTKYEDFSKKICFVRPYSYSYTDGRSGEEKTVTVSEAGKWIQLTDRYVSQIADNSQYCTGTSAVAAKVYCHLHELGFNAWYYCENFADPDEWIGNPMYMSPVMKLWGPVNILSRSFLLTGVESSINAPDPLASLDLNRKSVLKQKVKKNNVTYYYWSDEVSEEMTAWYNSSRKK